MCGHHNIDNNKHSDLGSIFELDLFHFCLPWYIATGDQGVIDAKQHVHPQLRICLLLCFAAGDLVAIDAKVLQPHLSFDLFCYR